MAFLLHETQRNVYLCAVGTTSFARQMQGDKYPRGSIYMVRCAFFDAKPYDRVWFDSLKESHGIACDYFESKLNSSTALLASGHEAVVAFVNDTLDAQVIDILYQEGVKVIAMRCAGYNNVDFKAAFGKIHVMHVPAYSPYAIAEHAMALLLTLNRKIHHAYNRTRDFNFSLSGLTGFDLHGKTIGVVGTGRIGRVFIDICKGFGMKVLAFDPYPAQISGIEYVDFPELCRRADIISLHCPLRPQTHHIIGRDSLQTMKDGVYLVNTSRGGLVDSDALLEALKSGKIGGAALDVYEEESQFFYEDWSNSIVQDDVLARLLSLPNVVVTSHQAFLTNEALENIAEMTLENIRLFFANEKLPNEICYECIELGHCAKDHAQRCF